MRTTVLPDRLLAMVPKEQREKLGKAGVTSAEAKANETVRRERDMHDQFAAWCALNGILVVRARFGVKSTIRAGWPDFTLIYHGKVICIEFKMPGEKLRLEQEECFECISKNETVGLVCDTVEGAIAAARVYLLKK